MTTRMIKRIGDRDAIVEQHEFEFPYSRSVGRVIGEFLTGLRDQRVLGSRLVDGRVFVPPVEYDPATGADCSELVEVASAGVIKAWAWVNHPRSEHLFSEPFAWALITLDGADAPLLHVVRLDGPRERLTPGVRVVAEWRAERCGHITDIECFRLEEE